MVVSCQNTAEDLKYGILAYDKDDAIVFASTADLKKGNMKLHQASKTEDEIFFTERAGYYYAINQDRGEFVKYRIEKEGLKKESAFEFVQSTSWRAVASWHSWVSDHEILLGSSCSGKQFMYVLIDVDKMEVVRYGKLDIPLPDEEMNYGGVMGRLVDSTLYIAYMLYPYTKMEEPAGDTIYLASIDYPSMRTKNITVDARSTFPGGYNLFWQVSAVHNGYLYFIAQPGNRLRFHPTHRPAIMRIKIGDEYIDRDYFFQLSDNAMMEYYGLFDIGEGRVLTKAVDNRLVQEFSDYFTRNIVDYYLLDLEHMLTMKMPLPKDVLDFHSNVCQQGNTLYIGIRDTLGESDVWLYDLSSRQADKGLHVEGELLMLNKMP
ncbi:hypothetical protein [Sphingobacterium sp. LRF_L2]|uniref:hypothetical protein n=1 Tax=Sphingobacterium sp. LRF_L2 TaxID=3369421 RepID=UPI003F60C480